MPSTDASTTSAAPGTRLVDADRRRLLVIARASIAQGLEYGHAAVLHPESESETLRAPGAAFVTLELYAQLRGCIGSLEASPHRSLAADVSDNAFAAAFRDPRFEPLHQAEFAALHISISVIGPRQAMACASEDELLAALCPGVDGLILEAGARRGTFLPSVWEQLPRAEDFLRHLKRKAGLSAQEWPENLRAWRYRTEYFGE